MGDTLGDTTNEAKLDYRRGKAIKAALAEHSRADEGMAPLPDAASPVETFGEPQVAPSREGRQATFDQDMASQRDVLREQTEALRAGAPAAEELEADETSNIVNQLKMLGAAPVAVPPDQAARRDAAVQEALQEWGLAED